MNVRQQRLLCHKGNKPVYLRFMIHFATIASAGLVVPPINADPGRTVLAVFESWVAFRDDAARRCFAVTRPEADGHPRGGAALSVLVPRPGARPQIHVRLARPRGDAPAFVEIGTRRIALMGRGADLWIADPADDARLQAAMRGGTALRIRSRDAAGRVLSDRYPLAGFATVLDAATIGCARPAR